MFSATQTPSHHEYCVAKFMPYLMTVVLPLKTVEDQRFKAWKVQSSYLVVGATRPEMLY